MISQILSRIRIVSLQNPSRKDVLDIFSEYEKHQLETIRKDFEQQITSLIDGCWAYSKYLLSIKHFETSVFYHKHQMFVLENISNLEHKNFIDVVGYIDDIALVLSEYTQGTIYSFEAVSKNFELMLKTIELNGKENNIPIKLGLGSQESEMEIKVAGR